MKSYSRKFKLGPLIFYIPCITRGAFFKGSAKNTGPLMQDWKMTDQLTGGGNAGPGK